MRILLRAGKSPLQAVKPRAVIRDDLIARNTGNLLFAQSVYKSLFKPENQIEVNQYKWDFASADEINETYDALVLPLANAFRPGFENQLVEYTRLVKQLKMPCVVVGVGLQADLDPVALTGSTVDGAAREFVSAILDKSATIGVRGEITAEYLRELGFTAVDIIGCPSLFLNGDHYSVAKKTTSLADDSNIALNLDPEMGTPIGQFFRNTLRTYPNAIYVAQNRSDARLLLSGRPIPEVAADDVFPSTPDNPIIADRRTRLFVDVPTWIDFMATRDFAAGTRIHGNVAALLAGVPGHVIAHDSRTLELARFHQIPHTKATDVTEQTTLADLYAASDYSAGNAAYPARFEGYKVFLEKNGLDHGLNDPKNAAQFDARIAEISFSDALISPFPKP